jgi:VWFA-related protein
MVWGRQSIGAGVLAMLLAGTGAASSAQQNTQNDSQVNAPTPQQQVPNAPAPQTLPQLNTITPVAPAAPQPRVTPAAAPRGALPSAPAPSEPVQDQGPPGPPAVIPAAGQGAATAYRMGVVHVDFVQVPFTVKDSKGHLVPAITARDVRIFENGVRQHIAFYTMDPYPVSVALVIDQSVTYDTMDKINASLSALQGAFTPYDSMAVFTYNNGVKEQTTFTAAQSARLGVILDRSKGPGREQTMYLGGPLSQTTYKNNEPVDPNTQPPGRGMGSFQTPPKEFHTLYDAIFQAAQALSTQDPERRRVIFVISDGKEYGSTVKEKELVKYLQTNQIAVYATLVGDSSMPGMGFLDRMHLPLTMRDDVLPRISAATGGDYYGAFRPRAIEESFAKISETVRYQYTVAYYTHLSPLDNKFRHVEVQVMRPDLQVISEDGYYPRPKNMHPGVPVSSGSSAPTESPQTPQP